MIEVSLVTALICFGGSCHPVLVGAKTPVGEFALVHRATKQKGYGGDILVFSETKTTWFAIHRTWPGRERLYANASVHRRGVTLGCINVQPEIYDALVECCADQKLVVKVN